MTAEVPAASEQRAALTEAEREALIEAIQAGAEVEFVERILADRAAAEDHGLRVALEFYADPATYHAIAFMFDRPCGEFEDDFSEDHGDDFYHRAMPGARARAALDGDEAGRGGAGGAE